MVAALVGCLLVGIVLFLLTGQALLSLGIAYLALLGLCIWWWAHRSLPRKLWLTVSIALAAVVLLLVPAFAFLVFRQPTLPFSLVCLGAIAMYLSRWMRVLAARRPASSDP